MQVQKDNIREEILAVSRKMFLADGYQKSSMRDIADKVGISVSNLYNYFQSKDAIFCAIVQPVVATLYDLLEEHHGNSAKLDVADVVVDDNVIESVMHEYSMILKRHRALLKLLLFQAKGTSLEHFVDEYTDRSTVLVRDWFRRLKAICPSARVEVSDLFVHINTVWIFTLLKEVIGHNLTNDEAEKVLREYVEFEMYGWANTLNVDPKWFVTKI